MTAISTTVRKATPGDRDGFLEMWADFVAMIPGEPGNHTMGQLNWERAIDPAHPLDCILAVDADGRAHGFTLYLAFPFTWSTGDVCYLQDIYVRGESRGNGIAQQLIAHLKSIGETEGWFKIFWMTQHDNAPAQRVYDKVAKRMDYIRYDLTISEP
jgi:GNAT superfamily N-acetyltransferase